MTEEQERIKKRVIELEEILYEAQEELKDLQNQCNHEDTSIEDYMWDKGHVYIKKVCTICKKIIPDDDSLINM